MPNNLTDLLQAEARTFTSTEGESVIDITANEVITEDPASESDMVKTDLQVTVKELSEILEKAQKQESALYQQISDLQASLFTQKTVSERLQKELDEARQVVLQLAESNSQLLEEIKEFKQVKEISHLTRPMNHKKSHRTPERLQELPTGNNDDFATNTWLYD
jgi:chromosome segregation ATPase